MSFPGVRVEVGFGATWQTEPASITWIDITAYALDVHGLVAQRGASAARGQVDAGSLSLSLKNADRRFDPTYTAGPYYGDLKPGVPIKITCTAPTSDLLWGTEVLTWGGETLVWGTPIPVWYGSVKKWPQRYDIGNTFAWVPLECWDGFADLARAKIPRSVLVAEVLADSPDAYWRLNQSSESQPMVDSSGNLNDGDYANVTFTTSLVDDDGGAMTTTHVGDSRGRYVGNGLPLAAPITLEAWVQFDRELSQLHMIITNARDYAYGSGLQIAVEDSTNGSPNGELIVDFRGLGSFYKARGSTRIDDGLVHHVAMTMASNSAADIKLYVDGVEETKTTVSGTNGGSWPKHLIWAVGNAPDNSSGDYGLGGTIDEVAVYPSALSAARVLAHYNAGHAPLDAQTTDQRIGWVLDQLDWPTNLRTLSTGRSTLGPATLQAGDKALDYLRLVAATEDSRLFMGKSGHLTFQDRYWRYLDTLATVSQITFSDQNTGRGYAEFQLDTDDELLVNIARYTRRGGSEQIATEAASVAAYGEAEKQQTDLLLETDAEVQSLARWTVATQSTPLPRVPSIRIPLHDYSAADQASVLGLDLGHRVTCNRTPQGVGSAVSLDFVVDGIRHEVNATEWWTTLFVSPAPDNTVHLFVLGTSELGSTDILAY